MLEWLVRGGNEHVPASTEREHSEKPETGIALYFDPASHHFLGDRLFDRNFAGHAGDQILAPYAHMKDYPNTRFASLKFNGIVSRPAIFYGRRAFSRSPSRRLPSCLHKSTKKTPAFG
jgi:hypothetical protein